MLKILKDIGLAMINATLILTIVALLLAWKVTGTADQIMSDFARNLVTVDPLRQDVQDATTELAAMRSDLAGIRDQTGNLQSASLQRIETRLIQMETRLEEARTSLADLSQAPVRLVDHAIDTTATRMSREIRDFRGCVPES
jgi:chromosome segregation ATPase